MKKIIKPTKYILFFGIFLCVLFFSYKAIKIEQMGNVLGASSPWTQTDWSGGQDSAVVSGSVNTYLSKAEMNTDVANSLTVSQISGWSADYTQWAYRRKIVFDNTDLNLGVPAEALVDFPVLVKLDAAQEIDYTKTQNQGQDIRFTDSDGTILNYEIETWDESGSSFIWVKVPSININSNTDSIYMYYNNPDAVDAQNRSSVWSNGYAMVQHLNDASTSTVIDSTSNNYTGTKRTTNAPVKIPGKIGFAQDCGPSDYIDLGNILNPGSNNFTVEIWFRRQSVGTANINILYNKENLWETAAGGGYTTLAWMPYWNWVGGSASPLTLNQ